MQRTPGSKPDGTFNWLVAGILGLSGIYNAVTGSFEGNVGVALYGLGKTLCGLFFVLHALNPAGLPTRRAGQAAWALLIIGAVLGILGFCMKRGII